MPSIWFFHVVHQVKGEMRKIRQFLPSPPFNSTFIEQLLCLVEVGKVLSV